jgi:hypothetical protein
LSTAGNIGVNTNAPATSLDVNGPSGVTTFTGTTWLGLRVRGSTGNSDFSGIDFSADNLSSPVARIASYASPSGSYLQFGTTNSYGSGLNTAMTINPTGNVGIGTTTPAYPLVVSGTGATSSTLLINDSAGSFYPPLSLITKLTELVPGFRTIG